MKKAFLLFLLKLLPETRCFSIKRSLLRLVGYEIGHDVRVCSSARFLGAGHIILKEGTWIGQEMLLVSTSLISVGSQSRYCPQSLYWYRNAHSWPGRGKNGWTGYFQRCGYWRWSLVGTGSILLPGTRIGRKSVIAAGAVVTGNIGSLCIAAGVPAKP